MSLGDIPMVGIKILLSIVLAAALTLMYAMGCQSSSWDEVKENQLRIQARKSAEIVTRRFGMRLDLDSRCVEVNRRLYVCQGISSRGDVVTSVCDPSGECEVRGLTHVDVRF